MNDLTELASTTSPDTGAYTSEAALTDSTDPNGDPAVTAVPTAGSSTNTTSPKASAACFVIPTVPISPLT